MKIKQLLRVIKIYKKQIEDLQVEKSSLLNLLASLGVALKNIELEKITEMEKASQGLDYSINYEVFFKSLKLRAMKIGEEKAAVEANIAQINDQIVEVFKEQRKYEILIDKLKLKELEKENKEEIKLFDELNIFKRKEDIPN